MTDKKKTKKPKVELVEIEGVKCKVKDAKRKAIALHYQEYVRESYSDYVLKETMTPSRQSYSDGLLLSIRRAPFLLGWLHWPEDENERRVIMGREPIVDKKKKSTKKVKRKKRVPKKK